MLEAGADKELPIKSDGEPDKFESNTPLHLAAGRGHVSAISALYRAGVQLEARDNFKFTALHIAACSGHAAAITLLLTLGAQKEARDFENNTLLFLAASMGNHEAIKALLLAGADKEAKNYDRRLPYMQLLSVATLLQFCCCLKLERI